MLTKTYRVNVGGRLVDTETGKIHRCKQHSRRCRTWECYDFTKAKINGDDVACCGVMMLGWLKEK